MAVERTINASRDAGDPFADNGTTSTVNELDTSRTSLDSSYEVRPDRLTTAEIAALDAEIGRIVYDTETNTTKFFNGTSWQESAGGGTVDYGIVDYNDASTSTTPVALVADTWTDVPNDKLGAFTNELYMPDGVTSLMNANGELDFTELSLGSSVFIRNDVEVTPNVNNALLEARYVLGDGLGQYTLGSWRMRLDTGSGIAYPSPKGSFFIYMGDLNTRDAVGKLQVKLSSSGTLKNNGVAIGIFKK